MSRKNSNRRKPNAGKPDTKNTGTGPKLPQNEVLLRDAANLAFSRSLGTPYKLGTASPTTVPGIMALNVTPTLGGYRSVDSPINIAAKQIYSWVRHANSGRANYESADLLMYIVGVANIYAMFSYAANLYGIARTFNLRNRYYARAIITAHGYDYEDFISNLSDFRYRLNVMATRLNSLAIPKTFEYVQRALSQYVGLYLDGDNDKAQTYTFKPTHFYLLDVTSSQTGTSLVATPYTRNILQPEQGEVLTVPISSLLDDIAYALEQVIPNEDFNIMSGDILKAYGSDNLVQVATVPEDFSIEPVYDANVLESIHNATLFDLYNPNIVGSEFDVNDVRQVNGYIVNPITAASELAVTQLTNDKLMNVHVDNPTYDVVVNAIQYMANLEVHRVTVGEAVSWQIDGGLPLFLIHSANIYAFAQDNGDWRLHQYIFKQSVQSNVQFDAIARSRVFKNAPMLYRVSVATPHLESSLVIGDVQNYTVITSDIATRIHDAMAVVWFDTFKLNTK